MLGKWLSSHVTRKEKKKKKLPQAQANFHCLIYDSFKGYQHFKELKM